MCGERTGHWAAWFDGIAGPAPAEAVDRQVIAACERRMGVTFHYRMSSAAAQPRLLDFALPPECNDHSLQPAACRWLRRCPRPRGRSARFRTRTAAPLRTVNMVSIAQFKQAFASAGTNDSLKQRDQQVEAALKRLKTAVDKAEAANRAIGGFKTALKKLVERFAAVKKRQAAGDQPGAAAAELDEIDRQIAIVTDRLKAAPARTPPRDGAVLSETMQTDVRIISHNKTGAEVRTLTEVRSELITWLSKRVSKDRASALVDASNLKELHRQAGSVKQSSARALRAHLQTRSDGIDSVRFSIDQLRDADLRAPPRYVDVYLDVFDVWTDKPIKRAEITPVSVIDVATRKPIPESGSFSTYTDDEGRALLVMRENTRNTVRVSAPGYETDDNTIKTDTAPKLETAMRLLLLDKGRLERSKAAVEINVKDRFSGSNVPKAAITIGSESRFTNADGFASFTILPGSYDFSVTADGYVITYTTIIVEESQEQQLWTFEIEKSSARSAILRFTIVDKLSGKKVENASVAIETDLADGKETSGASTNADGYVGLRVIPGIHKYRVDAPGYHAEEGQITVTESTKETIRLRPKPRNR